MNDANRFIKRDRVVISSQTLAQERQDFYTRTSINRPDYFPRNHHYEQLNATEAQQKPDKTAIR